MFSQPLDEAKRFLKRDMDVICDVYTNRIRVAVDEIKKKGKPAVEEFKATQVAKDPVTGNSSSQDSDEFWADPGVLKNIDEIVKAYCCMHAIDAPSFSLGLTQGEREIQVANLFEGVDMAEFTEDVDGPINDVTVDDPINYITVDIAKQVEADAMELDNEKDGDVADDGKGGGGNNDGDANVNDKVGEQAEDRGKGVEEEVVEEESEEEVDEADQAAFPRDHLQWCSLELVMDGNHKSLSRTMRKYRSLLKERATLISDVVDYAFYKAEREDSK